MKIRPEFLEILQERTGRTPPQLRASTQYVPDYPSGDLYDDYIEEVINLSGELFLELDAKAEKGGKPLSDLSALEDEFESSLPDEHLPVALAFDQAAKTLVGYDYIPVRAELLADGVYEIELREERIRRSMVLRKGHHFIHDVVANEPAGYLLVDTTPGEGGLFGYFHQ